ncbi:MAG: retron St85 family RNA-directed DNA polymerase [Bacteroidales bacterium]|nr:retron St85 family RNA-directed DNA polymerase [Bacteroidales bacterium]
MKSNSELLRLLNLPVFSDEEELASLMHITPERIKMLSKFPHRYYKKYKIPKSNGKLREIRQPRKDLKAIQAWILRNILDKLSPTTFATAYIKNRNISDNVTPHSNNRHFVLLDLEDFFSSISIRRAAKVFLLIGYSKKAASILARLCTCDGSLPQGAVTSPSLSNLIAAKLDRRIAGYTSRRNIIYTRYADDITLSSNNPATLSLSLPRIIKIIKSEHLKPNMDKLRVLGPRKRCSITGLVKNNSEPEFGIGKKKKKQMRAVIHHFLFNLSKDDKYTNKASIIGWLNYLKSVDKESFEQMNNYWNQLIKKSNSV